MNIPAWVEPEETIFFCAKWPGYNKSKCFDRDKFIHGIILQMRQILQMLFTKLLCDNDSTANQWQHSSTAGESEYFCTHKVFVFCMIKCSSRLGLRMRTFLI